MNNVNGFGIRYFIYLVSWIFDHFGINNLVFSVLLKFDAFHVPYFSYIYFRFYFSWCFRIFDDFSIGISGMYAILSMTFIVDIRLNDSPYNRSSAILLTNHRTYLQHPDVSTILSSDYQTLVHQRNELEAATSARLPSITTYNIRSHPTWPIILPEQTRTWNHLGPLNVHQKHLGSSVGFTLLTKHWYSFTFIVFNEWRNTRLHITCKYA